MKATSIKRNRQTYTCSSNGERIRQKLNYIETQLLLACCMPSLYIYLTKLVAYALVVSREILPVSSCYTHARQDVKGIHSTYDSAHFLFYAHESERAFSPVMHTGGKRFIRCSPSFTSSQEIKFLPSASIISKISFSLSFKSTELLR